MKSLQIINKCNASQLYVLASIRVRTFKKGDGSTSLQLHNTAAAYGINIELI